METRANYTLIGAFTLAVIAAAFLFVWWFSGGGKAQDRKTYQIIFNGSVSGLSRGASVLFNGLRVGEVTQIDLREDDPSQVAAIIAVSLRTPVKEDTRARLEMQGLTGVASIALTGGSATAAEKKPFEKDAKAGVIYADRSDFQNLLENVQNLTAKADSVLGKADQILAENSGSLKQSAANVERFTASLAAIDGGQLSQIVAKLDSFMSTLDANRGSVESTLKEVAELSRKLNASADKLDGVLASAQGFLGDPATGDKAGGMMRDISDAAKSMRKLADNLDGRTKEITLGINRFTGPVAREYEALAVEGRRAIGDIGRAARTLERNPSQVIFGGKSTIPEYSPSR
jgi:phospholipid/cholesterol/gamma-HCH transport system substrate-binding protein